LREWFDDFTSKTGEQIETVLIDGELWPYDVAPASVLDLVFDDGYGSTQSPSFCAWSASFVVFPVQYDGAEWWDKVPRNPTIHNPIQPGGS